MMADQTPSTPPKKTILLAEDSESIRAFVIRVLSRAGYDVLEAKHGAEALRIAAAHDGKIDLFISDVYMPGLRAPEVAEQLRLTRPDIRVLYMSGYTEEDVARSGGTVDSLFLRKPFSIEELSDAVRDAIDSSSGR